MGRKLGKYFLVWLDLRSDFFEYSKNSVVILHNVIDETEDVLWCLESRKFVMGYLLLRGWGGGVTF